tara:strand:- start:112 stop:570 length:459 start_codon:yes stop_codon:yes gene_type:complete
MNKKQKRSARCLCVQLLYSSELSKNNSVEEVLKSFFKNEDQDLDNIIYTDDEIIYAKQLTNYAFEHIVTIDKLIQDKLKNWAMHRLAIMDKVILRMSISEMFYMEGIPPKVSMAEGIEIAKQFSTIDSSGFINGILDAIYNDNKNSINKKVV